MRKASISILTSKVMMNRTIMKDFIIPNAKDAHNAFKLLHDKIRPRMKISEIENNLA